MLTTAKSIQLLDASGMNISPITDITSLYYEVENPSDNRIISRKYVYDAFPVGVNINSSDLIKIGKSTGTSERHPADKPLYDNGQLYKIGDVSNNDILVSRVDTDIIPGTTLRELKVTNYNLSEILSYYTPLDLMDASYGELIEDISVINASIRDVSNRIADISKGLNAESCTLHELMVLAGKAQPILQPSLVPNKFYLINNYYTLGNIGGCMKIPNNDYSNFSGPTSDNSLSLLVKANDASTLDGKLYEMYDHSGKALHVYGTYKLSGESGDKPFIQITYMKDQYGNEAPYDFYNLKYKNYYTYTKQYTDDDILNAIISLEDHNINNNIIKTDPYSFKKMIVFGDYSLSENDILINNNIIGVNNDIFVFGNDNKPFIIKNNIIKNNNKIFNDDHSQDSKISFINTIIGNNNIIFAEREFIILINSKINNNNIINYITGSSPINLNNLNINSSNNITLYRDASNITILNNCDGSINLSDNIIVDNYISSNTLTTTPNSVYLFKQDVYAKSFNTLK